MQNILSLIVKYSIYVLVFLMPLFWLPFSFEAFEYSKQYLIFALVLLAFFSWLAKQVIYERELSFRWTFIDIFVGGFLLLAIVSAIFSVDKNSSLFGFYGRFSNGLIGALVLGILYFLITNNVGISEKSQPKTKNPQLLTIDRLLKVFLWASGLAVLTGYFSIFGLWAKIGNLLPLPAIMFQQTFNLAAGSLEGLSVFLAAIVVFLVGLIFTQKGRNIFYWLLLPASLGLLVIIDYTAAWLVILLSLFLFVAFSVWKRIFKENVNRLLIPIFFIIVAVVLIFLQQTYINLPKEQVLDQQTSWQVAYKSAIGSIKQAAIGSGIGTFHYDFAKEKPLSINQNWLWQIRFDRAGSYLAELLATVGVLGVLSYLGLIGMFLLMSYFVVSSRQEQNLTAPLFMVFLALLVSQFVYYQNTILAFSFWLILGLAVVSWQKFSTPKTVSFKDFPELSLVLSTIVITLGIAILALYFYAGKFYLADIKFNQGLTVLGEKRIQKITEAVKLNPSQPRYRTALARSYLNETILEMTKPAASQDVVKMQGMVASAINEARIASVLEPNQVVNWETLAILYREIRGLAAGAVDWGIKSFERAIELEPTNPVLYTELGKLYLVVNDTVKAGENFDKALAKKSDYADALIQKALVLEREDIVTEAIGQLERLVTDNSFNIEALFQLGRLYFNEGRIDEAIVLFKRIVVLVPNHSNAHYSLGIAYAAQGEKNLAVEEFEKVLELNPGQQDVIQKLESLRSQ